MTDPVVKPRAYKRYLLLVLMLLLAFNYTDRLALGLVLQNIKVDFHASDTELGFLSGIAFAFFYSVMGFPIAYWADRGNRVTIISLTAALWSLMVVFTGRAANFTQLLLVRVGSAVGESGLMPPANSLIPDYFDRAERPRAVAIYMLGGSLSNVFGYFIAGWLNQIYGWRLMFMILGAPGIVLAAVTALTLREPRRTTKKRAAATGPAVSAPVETPLARPTIKQVWATLWRCTTFRHLLFCFSVVSFFGYGIAQWVPAFFIRSFGLKSGELGTWLALIYGLGGALGMYLGGTLASRRAAKNESAQLKALAVVVSCFGVLSAFVYLSTNVYVAFGLLGLGYIAFATAYGPLFATVQTLVPQNMRAMSIAVIYFFANLIGLGLGPLMAGALSDALRPILGGESLRYALLALCPGYIWAGWHLALASRSVSRDLETIIPDSGRPAQSGIPG